MNLQEQINRIHEMMGVVSEMKFFQRRANPSEIAKHFPIFAEQVFYDTDSYGQFKYELVLRSLEYIMWKEYNLGYENLPEQDEIDYVNTVADLYNDEIKRLYDMSPFKNMDVISEEMSIVARRRVKFSDIEKYFNASKVQSFKKDQPVEESINAAVRSLLYSVMPEGFEENDEMYFKVWDEIKKYINDKYGEELRQYFEKRQRDVDQENENQSGVKYIFVKHDKPYGNRDWRGFADGFDSFDEMITRYGSYVDVDWDEIKRKLDTINDYPVETFNNTRNSYPLRISSIGDKGNEWGYHFSIIKQIPEDMINKTSEINDEEVSEYSRTLKNARQQGVGLRFPKSAIKANPMRFRPYNRISENDPKVGTGKKP